MINPTVRMYVEQLRKVAQLISVLSCWHFAYWTHQASDKIDTLLSGAPLNGPFLLGSLVIAVEYNLIRLVVTRCSANRALRRSNGRKLQTAPRRHEDVEITWLWYAYSREWMPKETGGQAIIARENREFLNTNFHSARVLLRPVTPKLSQTRCRGRL